MFNKILKPCLFVCLLFLIFITSSSAQQSHCATYKFSDNQIFSSCNDLPQLNSSIHWSFDQASNTAKIAYRHGAVTSSRWVAWAINPTGRGMVGAQALIAFQRSDGSMRVYTSPINSYRTQLLEGDLSFPVSDLSATHANNEITIFATLELGNISSTVNQVWQDGPVISEDVLGMHPMTSSNAQSMATLDLLSGLTETPKGALNSNTQKKNIHGILNAVSWGILLPIGAMIARYLKVFPSANPTWFYLHIVCQTSAFGIGVAGVATGILLGNKSAGIQFTAHRIIGIVILCVAILQVIISIKRPKLDHKYRFFWRICHNLFGYSVIVLSIVNIFMGFDILKPEDMWMRLYVGILIGFGVVVAILEFYTWFVVLKRKKSDDIISKNQEMSIKGTSNDASRTVDIV